MLRWIYPIAMILLTAGNLQTFADYQGWMKEPELSGEKQTQRSRYTHVPLLRIKEEQRSPWWRHYRWLQDRYGGRQVELAVDLQDKAAHWRHVALADVVVPATRNAVMRRALAELRHSRIGTLAMVDLNLHIFASRESGPLHALPISGMREHAILVDSSQYAKLQRQRLIIELPGLQ
ncbi:MAG: hypothetical protein VCB99_12315 [Myxococcota bacterium]